MPVQMPQRMYRFASKLQVAKVSYGSSTDMATSILVAGLIVGLVGISRCATQAGGGGGGSAMVTRRGMIRLGSLNDMETHTQSPCHGHAHRRRHKTNHVAKGHRTSIASHNFFRIWVKHSAFEQLHAPDSQLGQVKLQLLPQVEAFVFFVWPKREQFVE